MAQRRTESPGPRGVTHENHNPKKTRGKRRAEQSAEPTLPQDIVEKAAIGIIRGGTMPQIVAGLKSMGLDDKTAEEVAQHAADRIALAADFERRHEFGLAIQQLRDVYATAMKAGKTTPAIHARRELNKLIALYNIDPSELEGGSARENAALEALTLIEEHLRPLELAPDDYPIYEVARIAADIVRRTLD